MEKEIAIFKTDKETINVEVIFEDETVWLTIDQMASLFEKSRSTINEHILHIFEEGELDEKELRALGQIVSGYLDFADRQAERQQPMTMKDWAGHLDKILTMRGEQLLQGNGSVSHEQAIEKAITEYKKYQQRTLSDIERDFLDSIKEIENKTNKK